MFAVCRMQMMMERYSNRKQNIPFDRSSSFEKAFSLITVNAADFHVIVMLFATSVKGSLTDGSFGYICFTEEQGLYVYFSSIE